VGTSGASGERAAPPVASAFSLPAFTCAIATCTGRNMNGTPSPPRSCVTAGPVAENGMCVSEMPARTLKSSIAMWCGVAIPGEA